MASGPITGKTQRDVRVTAPTQALVAQGPRGEQGPQGQQGIQGPAGTITATGVSANPFLISGFSRRDAHLTTTSAAIDSPQSYQVQETVDVTVGPGPGANLGNAGTWTVAKGHASIMTTSTRGIAQMFGSTHRVNATGDKALAYWYLNHSGGGVSGQSDEGITGINVEIAEDSTYFHGTVAVASGSSNQSPTLATSGSDPVTDGAFLINISRGTLAGLIAAPSVQLQGLASDGSALGPTLPQLPVTVVAGGSSIPLSAAWGYCASAIPGTAATRDQVHSVTRNFELGKIGGSVQPFVNGYAFLRSNSFPEQVLITSVGEVTGSPATQSVTFLCSNPSDYAHLFQGGIAGQYLSFDGNLTFSGMRSTYYACGSVDGTHIIFGMNAGGGAFNNAGLPMVGDEAATWLAPALGQPDYRGWHLFPGAEVVIGDTISPYLSPMLEQNPWTWAAGDVVECPHYPVSGGHAAWLTKQQHTPTVGSFGSKSLEIGYNGFGIGRSYQPLLLNNMNPRGYYRLGGGPLDPPPAGYVRGTHRTLLTSERFPVGALIDVLGVDDGDSLTPALLSYQQGPILAYDVQNDRISFPQAPFVNGFIMPSGDGHFYLVKLSGPGFTFTLLS